MVLRLYKVSTRPYKILCKSHSDGAVIVRLALFYCNIKQYLTIIISEMTLVGTLFAYLFVDKFGFLSDEPQ